MENTNENYQGSTQGPTEESVRLNEERLKFAHATAVDKLIMIIEQPLGILSMVVKLAIYGGVSAVCTVGLSSLMESRRLRKEAVAGYKANKHAVESGPQMSGMGTPHGKTPRQNPFPLKNMNASNGARKAA